MKTIKYVLCLCCLLGWNLNPLNGQPADGNGRPATGGQDREVTKHKRAWEFGIGASATELTRLSLLDFRKNDDGSYGIGMQKKDIMLGGNAYIARELNPFFYLDLQGTVEYTRDRIGDSNENRLLYMGGLGLQWRLSPYFKSEYIEPFLRVGANVMHKNFDVAYNGIGEYSGETVHWNLDHIYNKSGSDKRNTFPVSVGAGVNMWLNDNVGIGLQGDYLLQPHANVANAWHGTVRIIWRAGGKSKKAAPVTTYVEIEKWVEAPVEVIEVPVEVIREVMIQPAETEKDLCELFNNISFDFDKDVLTAESEIILDIISEIMKRDVKKRYLITGFTDSKGSEAYNMDLSRRRAKAVTGGLVERGVPAVMLKSRGVGKKISYVPPGEDHLTRRGDRKITVETVTIDSYWDYLPATTF